MSKIDREQFTKKEKSKIYFKTELSCPFYDEGNISPNNINLDFEVNQVSGVKESSLSVQITETSDKKKNITIISNLHLEISERQKVAFEEYSDEKVLDLTITLGKAGAFVTPYYEVIVNTPRKVLDSLQWRYKLEVKNNLESVYWSLDSEKWYRAYSLKVDDFVVYEGYKLPIEPKDEIEEFIKSNLHKPLYHELIQSAKKITYPNRFAATVLGGTALELGFKALLFYIDPSLKNRLHDTQIPPIHTYLERLDGGKAPSFLENHIKDFQMRSSVIEDLQSFTNIRNKCVHQGIVEIPHKRLLYYLELIEDFLRYIDYNIGYAWSFDLISDSNMGKFRGKFFRDKFSHLK